MYLCLDVGPQLDKVRMLENKISILPQVKFRGKFQVMVIIMEVC